MTDNRTTYEPAADTRLLVSLMMRAAIGDTITYDAMTAHLARPVTGGDGNLQSALRMLQRDEGMVFACERGRGYKRLSDSEIANQVGPSGLMRIRRAARRTLNTLTVAKDENLTNAERVKRNTHLAFMGAVNLMTRPGRIERLREATKAAAKPLDVTKTLELFKK